MSKRRLGIACAVGILKKVKVKDGHAWATYTPSGIVAGTMQDSVPTSPGPEDVEALRAGILREAEETFQREMLLLSTGREPTDTTSYKTVSSGQPWGDQTRQARPSVELDRRWYRLVEVHRWPL